MARKGKAVAAPSRIAAAKPVKTLRCLIDAERLCCLIDVERLRCLTETLRRTTEVFGDGDGPVAVKQVNCCCISLLLAEGREPAIEASWVPMHKLCQVQIAW
ncbi:MAG: hypothetical protein EBZ03_05115 [Betaproteobacteria bacterium]|nr:hypothetical protein [Betaproteobacteria bacterium]NBO43879.1 hypothetical protein [Betaproteobacteria bacterium]NBQ08861.1 hypothetical protein [Betaproteobacteria bacterium]NBQ80663.1 hypothetical protein [Betaproteobacteria bacterium]NBS21519.1 hypothetical protein [Betaproteobacteria bacterium]